jgi:hypothetical protein
MFQPSANNTRYITASPMSNSSTVIPSNTPNAPSSVAVASVGTTNLDLTLSWAKPSDFAEWSAGGFTVKVTLSSSSPDIVHNLANYSGTSCAFLNLARGLGFQCTIYQCVR